MKGMHFFFLFFVVVRAHSFQIKFLFFCLSQDLHCEENLPILHMQQGPHQQQFHMDFITIGLAYQGKDSVFRFTIEYSSLRDFGPYIIGLFWYEDFWKMIFWLVLKLEISYRVIIISWRILVSFRGFFWRLYFCKWILWVSMILLLH